MAEGSPTSFQNLVLEYIKTSFRVAGMRAKTAGRHFPTAIPGLVSKIDVHGFYLMDTNCVIWPGKSYKIMK